jgi:hypothetical protein
VIYLPINFSLALASNPRHVGLFDIMAWHVLRLWADERFSTYAEFAAATGIMIKHSRTTGKRYLLGRELERGLTASHRKDKSY